MSTAKALLLDEINGMSDDIDDEFQMIENLYKILKLKKSQQSVAQYGTLSSDEVLEHFRLKREAYGK